MSITSTLLERAREAKTEPVAGAAGAMASLITRLKSADPAARPTAIETAARLRWIRDTPRRRLRHAAIAALIVAAVAGAAKYTYDLARERTIAVAARDEANRRRGQAEDLIGFMLGDLRKNLEPVGRLDVLDGVGGKAMAYFAAVPAASLSDEELLRRSTALYQIGEVRIAQGNLEAATAPLEESLTLAQTLVSRQPNDGERVFGLAQSQLLGRIRALAAAQSRSRRAPLQALSGCRAASADDRPGPGRLAAGNRCTPTAISLGASGPRRSRWRAGQVPGLPCGRASSLFARAPDDSELARSVASSHNDRPRPSLAGTTRRRAHRVRGAAGDARAVACRRAE